MYPTINDPLARDVPPDGVTLSDTNTNSETVLPHGTVISATAYALHCNPQIWGPAAAVFRPERWMAGGSAHGKEKYLLHFGQGHRAYIGQNQALITLWKDAVAILQ
jgi:cytochrome P450